MQENVQGPRCHDDRLRPRPIACSDGSEDGEGQGSGRSHRSVSRLDQSIGLVCRADRIGRVLGQGTAAHLFPHAPAEPEDQRKEHGSDRERLAGMPDLPRGREGSVVQWVQRTRLSPEVGVDVAALVMSALWRPGLVLVSVQLRGLRRRGYGSLAPIESRTRSSACARHACRLAAAAHHEDIVRAQRQKSAIRGDVESVPMGRYLREHLKDGLPEVRAHA